ncbi:MAG: hypothetical protein DHS20C13_17740 [Thermodesulfobacteriota bacterium]|nr:MAG: hypothetical protein DHS20C13_17740 [Thermodesulfobacteriota bacterium]
MNRIKLLKTFSLLFLVLSFGLLISSCDSDGNNRDTITGFVLSGNEPIELAEVTLFSTGTPRGVEVLGSAITDEFGFFSINFKLPPERDAVIYATAQSPILTLSQQTRVLISDSVRLATVLGRKPVESEIVINERTTVATAYAMAQFFDEGDIDGPSPGLQNASDILTRLVELDTGNTTFFLNTFPNGGSTTTQGAFNSLANMLAACVRDENDCGMLFELATPPGGGTSPDNTLQAALNIAHFPWHHLEELFDLSLDEQVYGPSLDSIEEITAWILAIRYIGNGMELNGPGNTAFDAEGNAWIANNYVFRDNPLDVACGDDHVIRLTPTGEDAPGAPYQGGGLYGAGYGITLDPDGNVWVGNFAFQGVGCPLDDEARAQSVSKFSPDGIPISPTTVGEDIGGFKGAGNTIFFPQGTVSDNDGNIWIASCSGDRVTQFPAGDPDQAFVIQEMDDFDETIVVAPFDIAIDPDGNAWVTGNESFNIAKFDPEGNLIVNVSGEEAVEAGFNLPMGVATDTFGNAWIANSGFVTAPCDGNSVPKLIDILSLTLAPDFMNPNAALIKVTSDGEAETFKGGGLLMPWGIAVDGGSNVWLSNFDGTTISYFCGEDTSNCPPGLETGDPIAPEGYFFNGLKRSTSVEIDPSGNVWATNNWEILAIPENPGGDSMVVFIGAASPVAAPLIGPPGSPQ